MKLVFVSDKRLSEDTRLIKRLYRAESSDYTTGNFVFALQYLWFHEDKWLELVRIDNYEHEKGRAGVHIHKFGTPFVEFKEMNFTEAEQLILAVGEKIKQKILLGDYDGKN
ncbi:hypothetical protein HYU40_01740 [Candidatus Woesearchaeota archaeon]|nr:hypothetical protein [Candidatus Woesearchaeota archaeon]